ncbi:VOC family protein [Meridianimarinicoccus sp. RP-17]|uniref:VOC family protein n=1 Tax=Meridianimarinicoccus zhengii TaxID=2056810 RepID=UPI000DADC2F2|nr:VOC family protein [Phycocomes zhengii]
MPRPRIIGAAQLVPVTDLAASVAFYTGTLGFSEVIRAEEWNFVTVRREGVMLGLQGSADSDLAKITGNNLATQVWVRDLGALWADLSPALADLPEGRVKAPFRQPYGVHEFHVKDPDGFLMLFAEANDTDLSD